MLKTFFHLTLEVGIRVSGFACSLPLGLLDATVQIRVNCTLELVHQELRALWELQDRSRHKQSVSFYPPRKKGEGNFLASRFSLCTKLGTSFICPQLMFERFPLQNGSGRFSSLQSLDFVNANDSYVREGVAMSCSFSFPVRK